jgi:hypothetical protein
MTSTDPLLIVWQQYGWIGFLGYFVYREVWPFISAKVWPERVKQARAERERLSRLEERQLDAEDRQVAIIDAMGKSVHEMTVAIATNNERLSTLIAGHTIHAQETTQSIALMRERTGPSVKRSKGFTS